MSLILEINSLPYSLHETVIDDSGCNSKVENCNNSRHQSSEGLESCIHADDPAYSATNDRAIGMEDNTSAVIECLKLYD